MMNSKKNFLSLLTFSAFFLVLLTSALTAQKTQNRGGSGGGSPTPTPTPTLPNPLPQTPPAPNITYRESFGPGPYQMRPVGSKGELRSAYLWEKLGGFWIEYPGNKTNRWLNLDTSEGWRYCGSGYNPYELFSPLQVLYTGEENHGCIASGFDEPTGINPTALIPFTAPSVPYEVSFNGYPTYIEGKYIAVGLTNSGVLSNNLQSSNSAALFLYYTPFQLHYELRSGATVLISGETDDQTWNRLVLRVDPVQRTIGGSINEVDLGTFSANIGAPRYAGFEGIGIGDNFVVKKIQ